MQAMGDVLRYRPPKAREETTASIGMVIFLGSWAMMFAALFFAYAFVRSRANAWPPPGLPVLPRLLPAANTLVLALSSLCLWNGTRRLRAGLTSRQMSSWLVGALGFGALFLGLQVLLWETLRSRGLSVHSGGPYSSVFYGLTWLHALHVVVGLIGLALVLRRALAGELNAARHLPLKLWSMYWHFVDLVWVAMFISVFLV